MAGKTRVNLSLSGPIGKGYLASICDVFRSCIMAAHECEAVYIDPLLGLVYRLLFGNLIMMRIIPQSQIVDA